MKGLFNPNKRHTFPAGEISSPDFWQNTRGLCSPNPFRNKTSALLYSWTLAALGSAGTAGRVLAVLHFPPSMAVASAGGRTHKLVFPRLNWQQLPKPSLEFHKQTWPGAKQSPSWSIFPTATGFNSLICPPGRTSPSLTHPQVQLGDGSLPWPTATPRKGLFPKKGFAVQAGAFHRPPLSHPQLSRHSNTFTCTTQSSLRGRSKPEN